MLIQVKDLHGNALRALDGEIGKIDEILFDEEQWTVRYLIVDTGGWLDGRKVLIAPAALGVLDWDLRVLNVNLTRDQIEKSPGIETNEPVSRQWETEYYDYYAWPFYWGGMGLTGGTGVPGAVMVAKENEAGMSPQAENERARGHESARDRGDPHLRSTKEVSGYKIAAQDGHIGHVEDFIVDDTVWKLRFLAVDTRDWWPGKKVLLPHDWIGLTIWVDHTVTVDITCDQVRNAPEWDSGKPISPQFEEELLAYYTRQRRAPSEMLSGRMTSAVEVETSSR
ncbi:hypothetical protein CCAX7_61520 [Capsulimonas corticalis]|uniref:Uncharacterized protein n=1 Tax=Capsulimonas corticalis TaxID=2219043 RepID=A0A402CWB9_9BACT|nr:PRC-barrel domain-containing protein [Capsulimonas corticalis]BDI34101.1 hypothetical protein CCAX7_61520 [Capsulimonas corticalis]